MPDYRRAWAPGATWFFTVNLLERRGNDLLVRHIESLRRCVSIERARRPFAVLAWVVLPDHMHWIWRLPTDDADFATRWRRIKTDFSLALPKAERRSAVRHRRGEQGIWQRRYWELVGWGETPTSRFSPATMPSGAMPQSIATSPAWI